MTIHEIHITQTVPFNTNLVAEDNNISIEQTLELTQTVGLQDYMYSNPGFTIPPPCYKLLAASLNLYLISKNKDYSVEQDNASLGDGYDLQNQFDPLRTFPLDYFEALMNWLDELCTLMGWDYTSFYRVETTGTQTNIEPKHLIQEDQPSYNRTPFTDFELYGYDWCYKDYIMQVRDRINHIFTTYMKLSLIETNPIFIYNIANLVNSTIAELPSLFSGKEILRLKEYFHPTKTGITLLTEYEFPETELQPPTRDIELLGKYGKYLIENFMNILPNSFTKYTGIPGPDAKISPTLRDNRIKVSSLLRKRNAVKQNVIPTPRADGYNFIFTKSTLPTLSTGGEYCLIKFSTTNLPTEGEIYPACTSGFNSVQGYDYTSEVLAQSSWFTTIDGVLDAYQELGLSWDEEIVNPTNSNEIMLTNVSGFYDPDTTVGIYLASSHGETYCFATMTYFTPDKTLYLKGYNVASFLTPNVVYDYDMTEVFDKSLETFDLQYSHSTPSLSFDCRYYFNTTDYTVNRGCSVSMTDKFITFINLEGSSLKNRFGIRPSTEVIADIFLSRQANDANYITGYKLVDDLMGLPYSGVKFTAYALQGSGFFTTLTESKEYSSTYDPIGNVWYNNSKNINKKSYDLIENFDSYVLAEQLIFEESLSVEDVLSGDYRYQLITLTDTIFNNLVNMECNLIAFVAEYVLNESWAPLTSEALGVEIYRETGRYFNIEEIIPTTLQYDYRSVLTRTTSITNYNPYSPHTSPNAGPGVKNPTLSGISFENYYDRAVFQILDLILITLKSSVYISNSRRTLV